METALTKLPAHPPHGSLAMDYIASGNAQAIGMFSEQIKDSRKQLEHQAKILQSEPVQNLEKLLSMRADGGPLTSSERRRVLQLVDTLLTTVKDQIHGDSLIASTIESAQELIMTEFIRQRMPQLAAPVLSSHLPPTVPSPPILTSSASLVKTSGKRKLAEGIPATEKVEDSKGTKTQKRSSPCMLKKFFFELKLTSPDEKQNSFYVRYTSEDKLVPKGLVIYRLKPEDGKTKVRMLEASHKTVCYCPLTKVSLEKGDEIAGVVEAKYLLGDVRIFVVFDSGPLQTIPPFVDITVDRLHATPPASHVGRMECNFYCEDAATEFTSVDEGKTYLKPLRDILGFKRQPKNGKEVYLYLKRLVEVLWS